VFKAAGLMVPEPSVIGGPLPSPPLIGGGGCDIWNMSKEFVRAGRAAGRAPTFKDEKVEERRLFAEGHANGDAERASCDWIG
jgi:hypothetical protein